MTTDRPATDAKKPQDLAAAIRKPLMEGVGRLANALTSSCDVANTGPSATMATHESPQEG